VHDRAVVARGKLPPIVAGAPERPRGLLIGLPSGLSFEYRTDDVRLLGVRSGEFADRRDWIGRGGDFLWPLGKIARVVAAEPPPFRYARVSPHEFEALEGRLVSTAVDRTLATLAYDLVAADGEAVARVLEIPEAIDTPLGPGWKRSFVLDKRRTRIISFQASRADAQCGRLDAKSCYALLAIGPKSGYDLVIARGRLGDTLSERSTLLTKGIQIAPVEELSAWTLFEIPGATLPEDSAERRAAIEKCARGLK
jgi:hypothetical protein